jgi:hypothetical protein
MSSYHSKMHTPLTAGFGGEIVVFSKSQEKYDLFSKLI